MDEETLNLSIRKFLKMVGVNSQREIEQAVAKAVAAGTAPDMPGDDDARDPGARPEGRVRRQHRPSLIHGALAGPRDMSPYRILYGDIHNHNAHGYGVGSIERSLEIARGAPRLLRLHRPLELARHAGHGGRSASATGSTASSA